MGVTRQIGIIDHNGKILVKKGYYKTGDLYITLPCCCMENGKTLEKVLLDDFGLSLKDSILIYTFEHPAIASIKANVYNICVSNPQESDDNYISMYIETLLTVYRDYLSPMSIQALDMYYENYIKERDDDNYEI